MILGYHILKQRVDELFPIESPVKIGASSIDVTIGLDAKTEDGRWLDLKPYDESAPYFMHRGQFLLVSMLEHTYMPQDLSGTFCLKSTCARQGFGHTLACWVDPGWRGRLTMELKNYNEYKGLGIWPGMPIGQMVYMQTVLAGRTDGRYMDATGVQGPLPEKHYDAGAD